MLRNMGALDRWIRVMLGIVLLALVFVGPQTLWGYLGFIPLLTGMFGYCPLYRLLHISTDGVTRGGAPGQAA